MKITYDKAADAAYIYLAGAYEQQVAWVKRTYLCDPVENDAMINLDFDSGNKLGGIEIMDASKLLPKELLDLAEIIGE